MPTLQRRLAVTLSRIGDLFTPAPRPEKGGPKSDPPNPPQLAAFDLGMADACALAHERGLFRFPAAMAKGITRDDRVFACLNTRALAVLGLPQGFLDAPSPGDTVRARAKLEAAWPHIMTRAAQAEIINDVALLGFKIGALGNWDQDVPTLRLWDASFVSIDWIRGCFQVEATWTDEKGIVQRGQLPVTPGDGTWVVFSGLHSSRPWMSGAIRVLPSLVAYRQSNNIDWGRHGKMWGNPPKVAETASIPAGKTADQIRFAERLQELVGDDVITLPSGAKLSLLELKHDAGMNFKMFGPEFIDACIAIVLLGQNLTTSSVGAGGLGSNVSTTQNKVRQDYLEGDCQMLVHPCHREIVYPYYLYKHGIVDFDRVPIPYWDPRPPEDAKRESEVLVNVGRGLTALADGIRKLRSEGIYVDRRALMDRFKVNVDRVADIAEVEEKAEAARAAIAGEKPGEGEDPEDENPGSEDKSEQE